MVSRQKRLLVVYYVIFDGLLGMLAFALAYAVRFETGLIDAPKGQPPFNQYLALLPLIGLLAPLVFNLQGAYRLRRNRTRVDDFFAVVVGTFLTVVVALLATLYFQVYYAADAAREQGLYEVSQIVWGSLRHLQHRPDVCGARSRSVRRPASVSSRTRPETGPYCRLWRPRTSRGRPTSATRGVWL